MTNHQFIKQPISFLDKYAGRKISTRVDVSSEPLNDFKFQDKDLIIYGNEDSGIDKSILKISDHIIVIPMLGGNYSLPKSAHPYPMADNFGLYPNLNVAMTAGIITYQAMLQFGNFKNFTLTKNKPII